MEVSRRHDEGCDGTIIDEFVIEHRGASFRLAVSAYHLDDRDCVCRGAPWDYFHVNEIVPLEGGGTELIDFLPDPIPERPTRETILARLGGGME